MLSRLLGARVSRLSLALLLVGGPHAIARAEGGQDGAHAAQSGLPATGWIRYSVELPAVWVAFKDEVGISAPAALVQLRSANGAVVAQYPRNGRVCQPNTAAARGVVEAGGSYTVVVTITDCAREKTGSNPTPDASTHWSMSSEGVLLRKEQVGESGVPTGSLPLEPVCAKQRRDSWLVAGQPIELCRFSAN